MPKRLIEINKFTGGIVSTPSATDTDEQSAKYSSNIDPQTSDGRLQGIDKDKVLSTSGFASSSGMTVQYVKEMITTSDRITKDKTNLVIGKSASSTSNVIDTISIVENLYGNNIGITDFPGIESDIGEFNFVSSDDRVHIGLGSGESKKPKVIMRPYGKSIVGTKSTDYNVFDAELAPPSSEDFTGMFSEMMMFPIHGDTAGEVAISLDDTVNAGSNKIFGDFDLTLNTSSDRTGDNNTLKYHIEHPSGDLYPLKIGQIFKIINHSSTNDFSDDALAQWKDYDFNKNNSGDGPVATGDLFLYCGNTSEGAPILRFLGNTVTQQPSFAYAIKKDSSFIYKVSLTSAADTDAFGAGSINISKSIIDANDTVPITRQESRITSIDLLDNDRYSGNAISSISQCASPAIYNSIGLANAGASPYVEDSDLFYKNGYMKILYRHGVFYVASLNSRNTIYRLNAIDFHELSTTGIQIEDMTLDFTRIPDQLHAEDGKGMIRRTIEDQLYNGEHDPKTHNVEGWSNIPNNAAIIGICETFDCGDINLVETATQAVGGAIGTHEAYKITTVNQSRLTSGDIVRFAGMAIQEDDNIAGYDTDGDKWDNFNIAEPYTVSVCDDGYAFWIDTASNTKVPKLSVNRKPKWWNSKLWILYGKKSSSASFNSWDLFLYNTNTTEVSSSRLMYMADRTPPYQQARYHTVSRRVGNDNAKMWYPGQFAFIKNDQDPQANDDSSSSTLNGLTDAQVWNCGSDLSGYDGTNGDGNPCEWGIYDKAGRWASNGTIRVIPGDTFGNLNRPTDWVGGYYGPSAGDITGNLIFGNNIGWSVDSPRQVMPTNNSLHPLVPYSSLYNGNMAYPGHSINYTDTFNEDTHSSTRNSESKYHNRPKHAVTFIGKVKGDFVVQPGMLHRKGLGTSTTDYTLQNNSDLSRTFEVMGADYERIKTYNNDYTLFTIDDYSGHRGSVKYEQGSDALNLTTPMEGHDGSLTDESGSFVSKRSPKGGIELSRPNFGGPEIEPPMYLGSFRVYNSIQIGSHSSVNGGAYDTSTTATTEATDKGWDGYTPPYLFNPGSGYYVYINRSWQNMTNYSGTFMDGFSEADAESAWGFQIFNTTGVAGLNKNRWNNFSSTALSDNVESGVKPSSTNQDWLDGWWYQCSRFKFPVVNDNDINFKTPYNTMPSNMQAVCTMHKIAIADMGEISSIFPFVLNSNVDTTNDSSYDFCAGYLCATSRQGTQGSGALVLRTNFDYIWDLISDKSPDSTYHREMWHNGLFVSRLAYGSLGFGATDTSQSVNNRGTHGAEIINITDLDTVYNPNGTIIDNLQMKQSGLDKYDSIVTGAQLLLAPFNPLANHSKDSLANADYHWFINTNAQNSSNVYFGTNTHSYLRQEGSTYTEDLNSTFFSASDAEGDSGQLFSASDDSEILTTLNTYINFTNSGEGTEGNLEEGTYYYKLAYEYDNQYESTLTKESVSHSLTVSTTDGTKRYEYININIAIPEDIVNAMSDRITGIVVYRKYEGGIDVEYSKVGVISFESSWIYNSDSKSYNFTIQDTGVLQSTYFANNGIDASIEDTSLNYGLSCAHQGYLFVSRASHPELGNVKHYIFRSQPDNFYAFNWTEDFVIMPETPICMTSFNSRLYVWGENNLYKIDPYSMLVEDSYQGFSVSSKDSFVKTEYGLCFIDSNNIYLHDGNKPVTIGDPILYSSNDSIVYNTTNTDGFIKLEQGYRELIQSTLTNGHKPHVSYSGKHNSFLIHLSNSAGEGKVFAFNIAKRRWDLWDAPTPHAVTFSKDSDILIADNTNIYNYLKLESDEWVDYNRRSWDWFSKDINFGADTQDKVFRSIKFLGTPSIYSLEDTPIEYDSTNKNNIVSVQAYVDGDLIKLLVKERFYETLNLGGAKLETSINAEQTSLAMITDIKPYTSSGADTTDNTKRYQSFIREGHIIRIDDELMFVSTALKIETARYNYADITRGIMGTTAASHSANALIHVVSPVLKFPAGTKGKNLSIRLRGQKGYIDSIGVVYKPKSIK